MKDFEGDTLTDIATTTNAPPAPLPGWSSDGASDKDLSARPNSNPCLRIEVMKLGFRSVLPSAMTLVAAIVFAASWLQVPAWSSGNPQVVYEIPERIEGLSEGDILWVSKDAATGPDGKVDWDALGEGARESYETIADWPLGYYSDRTPEGTRYNLYDTGPRPGGIYHGVVHGFGRRNLPAETLEEQLDNAVSLIEGEVVAKQVGFTRQIPITLLSVRVDHFGDTKGLSVDSPVAHVFWPVAKFSIGSIVFEKGNPDYPEIGPDVGDKILFLSAQYHELTTQTALWADPRRMAYGRAGSNVFVPVEWGKADEGEGTSEHIQEVFDEVRIIRTFSSVEGAKDIVVRTGQE